MLKLSEVLNKFKYVVLCFFSLHYNVCFIGKNELSGLEDLVLPFLVTNNVTTSTASLIEIKTIVAFKLHRLRPVK